MSSLWKISEIRQLKTNQLKIKNKRPSPKHDNPYFSSLAQDLKLFLFLFLYHLIFSVKIFCTSIKGTSLFIFRHKKISAGMTVEAAIVLPLFLFFFLNLSCAIEMIRLHGNLELALWETGSRISVYGHILSDQLRKGDSYSKQKNSAILQEAGDIALSYAYVKREIIEYAGQEYLDQSPLLYGADGLQFVESEIFTSGDEFEIVMTYAVAPWIRMEGIRSFRMANRYYGHIWNGYEIPGADSGQDKSWEVVYVTENGVVYHEDRNCTHLKLTIRESNVLQVKHERNENGEKYTLCEKCGKGVAPGSVFISKEGDRYHYDRDCPGLKRTVYSIAKEEAGNYRPCSRCSGQ